MKNFYLIFALLSVFQNASCFFVNSQGANSGFNLKSGAKFNIKDTLTSRFIMQKDANAFLTGSTSSAKIVFAGGYLDADESDNTSSYLFTTTPGFSLTGSSAYKAIENSTLLNMTVSGTSNFLYGSPIFSGNIVIASGADVSFGIRTKMNVNVALGSGSMKLVNDLAFTDSKQMTGIGTMNLQNFKLRFGGKPLTFSSAITWQNASDIELNATTTLSSTWTFASDSVINGYGNVLDISSGGVLAIAASTTLYLTNVYLKGLGSTGNITFANATTSILRLSNVTIEMTGNHTISSGQVIVDGPVTVITKSNTWTFNSSGVLTINGQTLLFDRIGNYSGGIVPTAAGANLVLNNSARVLETNLTDNMPGVQTIAASTTLPYDISLSDDRTMSVTQTATLTGNGHAINMADHSNVLITVSASRAFTLTDIVLNGVQPGHFSLGSGASVSFGASTTKRIHRNITLSSTWSYSGDSTINANGNVIDISSSGVFAIGAGVTLRINDAYIKGYGSTGDITFANAASTLRLSNVVIEMTGSKTISSGNVIIDGPVTIITKSNTLTFSSSGVLTVNGQTLSYDRLGNVTGGISPTTAGANLVLNNGGKFFEIYTVLDTSSITNIVATFDHGPNNITFAGSATMAFDYNLSEDHTLTATTTGTLNGNGHTIKFSDHAATQLTVNNSVTLTLTEVVLDDLVPSHISLGSGSDIIFGTNSSVRLGKNATLNSTWKFAGTSMLDGRNKMLTLGSTGVIEAQSGAVLTLKDLTIYDVNGTNLRCADNTATITFDNVKIINRNTWNFATGAFAVTNNLTLDGGGTFVYQSAYASTINDNSTLFLTDGMTFSYDPAKGSGQAVAGQQNLVFTNTSSKLWCDGVTLKITNTGMRFTKGTIQFDRKCTLFSDASLTDTARALIFGDKILSNDPQINIGPDAKIVIGSGLVVYDLVEDGYLKYGDAVLLRHATYGLYIDPFNSSTQTGSLANEIRYAYANTTLYNPDSYFYVQPVDTNTRWGSGSLLGQQVLTGSYLKLECLADYSLTGNAFGAYSPNPGGASLNYLNASEFLVPLVASPTPPYYRASLLAYSYILFGAQYNTAYARIFKYGGSVGSGIQKGDTIYIQFVAGSGSVFYLGSKNDTISGSKKELFHYKATSFAQPPNFSTYYLWNLEDVTPSAYSSSSRYPSSAVTVVGSVDLSAVQAASNYQF